MGILIAIGVLASALSLYFSISPLEVSLFNGVYYPSNYDAFYHARLIQDTIDQLPGLMEFDSRLHPRDGGAWISIAWGYEYLMALISQSLRFVFPDLEVITILAHIPPFWSVLNCLLIVGICRALGLNLPMTAVAAFGFALSPLTQDTHLVGNIDHHFIELSFILLIIYTALRWIRQPDSKTAALVLGTTLGLANAFHIALFLMYLLLAADPEVKTIRSPHLEVDVVPILAGRALGPAPASRGLHVRVARVTTHPPGIGGLLQRPQNRRLSRLSRQLKSLNSRPMALFARSILRCHLLLKSRTRHRADRTYHDMNEIIGTGAENSLLEAGIELYVIDWGYPSKMHKYVMMEDYILGYMDNVIDFIRERSNTDKINLMGVCQGGTFSLIYASLIPEKLKNLILMVTPVDFDTRDGLLNVWSKVMDADLMIDTMGNIPGEFMNLGFLWLKPFQLILDKYVGLLDNIDDPDVAQNFMRMEKWIFDSPDQAGDTIRQFIKDLYQGNKLVKGELVIGGQKVDLSKITLPILNIYGEQDHLVPPHSSRCVADLVSSKDVTTKSFPLGHIGMYVSSRSQKELAPTVSNWLIERSAEHEESEQVSQTISKKTSSTTRRRKKRTNEVK